MAPESVKGLSGPKTDVYAAGIMLYELLSGGEGPESINDEGEVADVDWTLLDHCTPEAVGATKALIAPEVGARLSCKDALALLWMWPRAGVAAAEGEGSLPQ